MKPLRTIGAISSGTAEKGGVLEKRANAAVSSIIAVCS
jgi:hypothetical protein